MVFFINEVCPAEKKEPKHITSPPTFYYLGKANGNDVIKMNCESDDQHFNKIRCDFVQVLIIKKTDVELAEAREKRRVELSKITAKHIDDMKKGLLKEKMSDERRALLNSLTPEKKKYSDKTLAMVNDINKSKSKEEIIKILDTFEEFENKCCSIHLNNWKSDFQRISSLKWISNPGPQGLCNVVKVATLEANDDSFILWKFTEVTVSVDVDKKRNDIMDQWCGGIELNKPVVYSWDIPTNSIPDCQCIKYSW